MAKVTAAAAAKTMMRGEGHGGRRREPATREESRKPARKWTGRCGGVGGPMRDNAREEERLRW